MVNFPIGEPLLDKLSVNMISVDAIFSDYEGQNVLQIDATDFGRFIFVGSKEGLDYSYDATEHARHLAGEKYLLVLKTIKTKPSRITLAPLNQNLKRIYDMLFRCKPKFVGLSTNYVSFWRLAETFKEDGNTCIVSIDMENLTMWAIFNAGIMTGGWLCKDGVYPSELLTNQKILESSVKMVGSINVYESRQTSVFEVTTKTKLKRAQDFADIFNSESLINQRAKWLHGESVADIAMLVDGAKTISDIALAINEPVDKVLNTLRFLAEQGLVERVQ